MHLHNVWMLQCVHIIGPYINLYKGGIFLQFVHITCILSNSTFRDNVFAECVCVKMYSYNRSIYTPLQKRDLSSICLHNMHIFGAILHLETMCLQNVCMSQCVSTIGPHIHLYKGGIFLQFVHIMCTFLEHLYI